MLVLGIAGCACTAAHAGNSDAETQTNTPKGKAIITIILTSIPDSDR